MEEMLQTAAENSEIVPFKSAILNAGYQDLVAGKYNSTPQYAREGVDAASTFYKDYLLKSDSDKLNHSYFSFTEGKFVIPDTYLGRIPDWEFRGWTMFTSAEEEQFWDENADKFLPMKKKPTQGVKGYALAQNGFNAIFAGIAAKLMNADGMEVDHTGDVYDPSADAEYYQPGDTIDVSNLDGNIYRCILPLIGVWKPSSNAKATKIVLTDKLTTETTTASEPFTVYQGEIAGKTPEELALLSKVDLSTENNSGIESGTYYVRVPAGQETFSFDLTAFEPGTTADATVSFADGSNPIKIQYTQENAPTQHDVDTDNPYWVAHNSTENPARVRITAENIPLESSQGAGKLYNKVEITLTAPDKVTTAVYTFYIQRLNDAEMSLHPGNTPAGVIARDTGSTWTADKKAAVWELFKQNLQYGSGSDRPTSSVNQDGTLYNGKYSLSAWGENITDIDNTPDGDKTAIVAYQNSTLTLPEFELKDSEGDPVINGTIARTIRLKTAEDLTTALKSDVTVIEQYYVDGKLTTVPGSDAISIGQTEELDLRGMKLVPGVYSIEYRYTDSIAGKDYSSNLYDFSQPYQERADGFNRTLVVLPLPGDVDMDGAITAADGLALQRLLNDGLLNWTTEAARLFAYRVCDVDRVGTDTGGTEHSGTITERDVSSLLSGYTTMLKHNGVSDYFYLPLTNTAEPEPVELTPTETPSDDKPHLSVEYLGQTPEGERAEEPLEIGDSFWLGVKLENAAALPEGLKDGVVSFTFTLVYDSSYLMPVKKTGYEWRQVLEEMNPQWPGYDFTYSRLSRSEALLPRYDKSIVTLQDHEDSDGNTLLREMRFTVTLPEGAAATTLTDLSDGYLAKVRFQVQAIPRRSDQKLFEPVMGTREFVITTETSTAAWSMQYRYAEDTGFFGGTTINLKDCVEYTGAALPPMSEDPTPKIELENFVSGSDGNCYYGYDFSSRDFGTARLDGKLPAGLQYGDPLGGADKHIYGVPKEIGTFDFYVGDTRYYIEILPAPLELTIHPQGKYYGEAVPEPYITFDPDQIRDVPVGQTLTGTLAELAELALPGYQAPTISYVKDKTASVDSEENRIKEDTPANADGETYFVVVSGAAAKNYTITYTCGYTEEETGEAGTEGETRTDGETGWAAFTVYKRPILVQRVIGNSEFSYYQDYKSNPVVSMIYSNKSVLRVPTVADDPSYYTVNYTGGAAENEVEFILADLNEARHAALPKLPLTTNAVYGADQLTVSYNVWYTKEENPDVDEGSLNFKMTGAVETRPVTVENLVLGGEDAANYQLVNNRLEASGEIERGMVPENPQSTGLLVRKQITSIELVGLPDSTGSDGPEKQVIYTHGDPTMLASVTAYVTYNYDPTPDIHPGGKIALKYENLVKEWGLKFEWIKFDADGNITDRKDAEPGPDPKVSREEHDGYYFCLTVNSYDVKTGKTKELIARSCNPVKVEPKELTLTVQPQTRYYGEKNEAVSIQYSGLTVLEQTELSVGETGDLSALTGIAGYEAPETSVVDKNGNAVTQSHDAGEYYVTAKGGGSTNYTFRYVRPTDLTPPAGDDKMGYAALTVLPRPIIVTGFTGKVADIYTDTLSTKLTEQTAGDWNVTVASPTWPPVAPVKTYYYQTGKHEDDRYNTDEVKQNGISLSGDPVYGTDRLTLTYTAVYPSKVAGPQKVTIRDLTLTGKSAQNYTLVFTCNGNAMYGYPGYTDAPADNQHQVDGTVLSREITKIEVMSPLPPQTGYIHGQTLKLNGEVVGENALQILLTYSGEGARTKSVTYTMTQNGDIYSTTFADNGIRLTWDSVDGPAVKDREELIYAVHNGRTIYISTVRSDGTVVEADTTLTISVAKKVLTLTAKDQARYYGEENAPYEFTFNMADLAPSDRKILEARGLNSTDGRAAALGIPAGNEALEAINAGYDEPYVGPVFFTGADKNSDVMEGGWHLRLEDGETPAGMANYTFQYERGIIQIYRRPFVVTKITADPVYTIAADDDTRTFHNVRVSSIYFDAILPKSSVTYTASTRPGEYWPKDLALDPSGSAILDGDTVELTVTVEFPSRGDRPKIGEDGYSEVGVTVSQLEQITKLRNYILLFDASNANTRIPEDKNATGRLEDRAVEKFLEMKDPKTQYTYGEKLNLAGMQFNVQYSASGGVGQGPAGWVTLETLGELVRIHYWDPTVEIPTDQAALAKIYDDQETVAQAGDDLTIASYTPGGLTHQGKCLLVIAETRKGSGEYVTILSKPLEITPKPLTYTLTVDSKDYDGNTATTGTLTLNNIEGADEVYIDEAAITFNFIDPNVAYRTTPTLGHYGTLAPVTVEVRNIKLLGDQAGNYSINSEILRDYKHTVHGRPDRPPEAYIYKADRPTAPDVGILLSTNNNTNAIKVTVDRPASTFTVAGDAHNADLRYEYALEYLDENGQSVLWGENGYSTGSSFGGETVSLDGSVMPGALPRDTWFRAVVRLAETWNYKPSAGTYSVEGDLATLIEAAEDTVQTTPDKEAEGPATRDPAALAKTYRYRLALASAEKVKGQNGQETYASTLEAVWFNDYEKYQQQEELATAVNSPKNALYHGYYWDPGESRSLPFPLDLTKLITENLPGGTGPVQVNENDNLLIYVSKVPKPSTGAVQPRSVSITPEEVRGQVGGQPVQLTAQISPSYASPKTVTWSSSDETVVTVDENGVLTFVGAGTAVVTATTRNGKQASVTVTVVPASELGDRMINVSYGDSFMSVDEGGYFHPEAGMTRGEMAIMMARLFQTPKNGTPGAPMTFIDVPADAECAQAVALLSAWGVVDGIGGGYFEPDRLATRAEVAAVISRMLQLQLIDTRGQQHAFIDGGEENTWAYAELDALARIGIVEGTVSSSFEPNRAVTRAEAATMLWRILTTGVDTQAEELIVPKDVTPAHWAYEMILRAVNSAVIPLEKR